MRVHLYCCRLYLAEGYSTLVCVFDLNFSLLIMHLICHFESLQVQTVMKSLRLRFKSMIHIIILIWSGFFSNSYNKLTSIQVKRKDNTQVIEPEKEVTTPFAASAKT